MWTMCVVGQQTPLQTLHLFLSQQLHVCTSNRHDPSHMGDCCGLHWGWVLKWQRFGEICAETSDALKVQFSEVIHQVCSLGRCSWV